MKIKKSWIIIGAVAAIIIGYFIIAPLFKKPLSEYVTEKVSLGQVLQSISETGSVKATESASLSFKSAGRIARINVSVGNNVKKGDILAELDSSQPSAQLQNARATLEAAKQQYDKLLNGLTSEDLKTYENAVVSAKDDLQSAYDSALNTLNDAYVKIYNADATALSIQSNYFVSPDQPQIKVTQAKNSISQNLLEAKNHTDSAKASGGHDAIDSALARMSAILSNVYGELSVIRSQCDEGVYYSRVSSTDKTSLDTQKGYINTASSSVASAKESISSYKIALQKAQDNLGLKTASPRSEDVNIYRSQVEQAQATVNLYQSQVGDAYLISPIDAKITQVNAKKGEVVSPSESIIDLLSLDPFQIKVNIYEQDIVKVKQDDLVKIDLVAFPRQTLEGRVLSIDPAEKIVDNVVYYQVTIEFGGQPQGIRSGMTADIVIETSKKDNVLRVSKNAVENINGKDVAQVAVGDKIEDREVVMGLEGDDYVEIISGLQEGDEIVIGKK